jgi:cell wall-associated NlpC family hydrolase
MSPSLRAPRRVRHAVVAITIAATAACWAAGPAGAGIAGDHHSPTVVNTAFWALAARDTFEASGTPGDFSAYLAARNAAADAVATEMSLDPDGLRDAWAHADLPHQTAVLAALAELGKPYRFATSDPEVGFDCSGLTAYAWARAGVQLPHQSGAQIDAAAPRDQAAAMAGDLVQFPGHVMLYLGVGDAIVHAVNRRDDVELDVLRDRVRFGDPLG